MRALRPFTANLLTVALRNNLSVTSGTLAVGVGLIIVKVRGHFPGASRFPNQYPPQIPPPARISKHKNEHKSQNLLTGHGPSGPNISLRAGSSNPQRAAKSSTVNRRRRRSEEHTSELQSRQYLLCRLL